jgi:hypothetical protein
MDTVLKDLNDVLIDWRVIAEIMPGDKLWETNGHLEIDSPPQGISVLWMGPWRAMSRRFSNNGREESMRHIWGIIETTKASVERMFSLIDDSQEISKLHALNTLKFLFSNWQNVASGMENLKQTYGRCKTSEEVSVIISIHLPTMKSRIDDAIKRFDNKQ